jgi:hypothetical protein
VLQTIYAMRQELAAVWERSTDSREQLLQRLQDWCRRAEASGIPPLAASRRISASSPDTLAPGASARRKKKPGKNRRVFLRNREALLQLRFLVDDVLARNRIEFLDLHLFRHQLLVLRRGVEMAGSGS